MFILRDDNEPIKWPVKIHRPLSGGRVEKRHGFTGHFRVYDSEQLTDIGRLPDVEFVSHILVGWDDDLVDEHKQPIPFSDDTRDKLARTTYIKAAIFNAYWDMMAGREAKN